MTLEEKDIIERLVVNTLSKKEHEGLKHFLKTKENYLAFLNKFLSILIQKDQSFDLETFLELHQLSKKPHDFTNAVNSSIEELAELSFKNIQSDFSTWLKNSNNSTYLDHLSFLTQTQQGITHKERVSLRERLSLIEKLKEFELDESEIKTGIKLLERKAIRDKFNKRIKTDTTKPKKNKVAFVAILILTGSFLIAVTIPQFRIMLSTLVKKIFITKAPSVTSKFKKPDKALNNKNLIINSIDSVKSHVDSIPVKKKIEKTIKKYYLDATTDKKIGIKTYRKHFNNHANELKSIEGIWELNGKFKNYTNPVQLICAIRKIEDEKFELVFFDPNGLLWDQLTTKYYLQPINSNSKYRVIEYANKKILANKYASLSKSGQLTIQNSFILSEFNVKTKNSKERVLGKFTGFKEKPVSDSEN